MKLNTLLEIHSHSDIERIRSEIMQILKKRATQDEIADALLNYVLRCMREENKE